ncbi:MAG: glycosyltransferase group 2 family protein, partial [Deltaproteobacteria bacterium]|nr:glycosyltransferase group 2 family protein [Deltaproteobacteria bacterium]
MQISIVIPVFNEEENIEPLIREIDAVLAPLGQRYEIIAVDDGSKDRTFAVLRALLV